MVTDDALVAETSQSDLEKIYTTAGFGFVRLSQSYSLEEKAIRMIFKNATVREKRQPI